MQKTFIVTVKTVDGSWSMEKKISGDWLDLSSALSQLSRVFGSAFAGTHKLKTELGSGTGLSASDSLSPIPSWLSEI